MNDATIDLTVFRSLQKTAGEEFVTELVATFLEEAPTMLATLRTAWSSGSMEDLRRTAHSLKSNSLTFGATRLAEMARSLELSRADVESDNLDALEAEFRVVEASLAELCRG